jgi:hypothetical protein
MSGTIARVAGGVKAVLNFAERLHVSKHEAGRTRLLLKGFQRYSNLLGCKASVKAKRFTTNNVSINIDNW